MSPQSPPRVGAVRAPPGCVDPPGDSLPSWALLPELGAQKNPNHPKTRTPRDVGARSKWVDWDSTGNGVSRGRPHLSAGMIVQNPTSPPKSRTELEPGSGEEERSVIESHRADPDRGGPGWKWRWAPPGAACPLPPSRGSDAERKRSPPDSAGAPLCRDMGRVVITAGINL